MRGYTKLHGKIIHSSIWQQPLPVKVVWITMLAMADQDGIVEGSVGGLANIAGVSRAECQEALDVLLGPDPDSSDGTTGERIEAVSGGWFVLNHANYREKQTVQQARTAERVRRHREAKAKGLLHETEVTPGNTGKRAPAYASEDGGSSGVGEPERKRSAPNRPDDVPEQLWSDWVAHRKAKRAGVTETAIAGIRREAEKAGVTFAEALQESVTQGWQGFKAEWHAKAKLGAFAKPESASHAIPTIRHNSALDLGDPGCNCMSCRAMRRDQEVRA